MASRLPFFMKYPYTNFEQLNLDWLMETAGAFEGRLNTAESRISSLTSRMDTAEGDISSLKGRMTTTETNVTSLFNRMGTAEDDITSLKGRTTTNENDISSLTSRVTTDEANITSLNGRVGSAESNINSLRSDLNSLEDEVDTIPIVSGNPGGTGTTLNTIGIGGVTYTVPSGGGGGSTITPNPSGTATADLAKVDIDGTIYAVTGQGTSVIPNPGITPGSTAPDLDDVSIGGTVYKIPTTDISGLTSDVNSLKTRMNTAEGDISDLENKTDFLDTMQSVYTLDNAYRYTTFGEEHDSTNSVTLQPGTYLILASCEVIWPEDYQDMKSFAMENVITGLPASSTFDRIDGYFYGRHGLHINNNMQDIVTLTNAATIGIRSNIHRYDYDVTYANLWTSLKVIKIR